MRIVPIAAGVAALALTAQVALAQEPSRPRSPHGAHPGGMMNRPLMAQHMRMMDSLNARLDSLVARMNQATGDRKVAAMADVINELVAQRRGMQGEMRRMMRPGATPDSATRDSVAQPRS